MKNNLKSKPREAAAKEKVAAEWAVASLTTSVLLGTDVSVLSGADHRLALWQNPIAISPKTMSKMPIFQAEPTRTERKNSPPQLIGAGHRLAATHAADHRLAIKPQIIKKCPK